MALNGAPRHGTQPVSPSTQEIKIFRKYDRNKTGGLEVDELKELMADLGLLNGRPPADASTCIVAAFSAADQDRDNALNLAEFTAYYRRATAPHLASVMAKDHPDEMTALRQAFIDWASFGTRDKLKATSTTDSKGLKLQMMSAQWLKLCRDTGIVRSSTGGVSSTEADLIFAKVRSKGQQRLNFVQFVDALGLVASKCSSNGQQGTMSIVRQIISSPGPVLNGTMVTAPRFDPGSQLTKSNREDHRGRRSSSGSLLRVSNASEDAPRDKHIQQTPAVPVAEDCGFTIPAHRSSSGDERNNRSSDPVPVSQSERLLHTYAEFAAFGKGGTHRSSLSHGGTSFPFAAESPIHMQMDSKQFMKLCRDSGLVDSPATAVAADLCYAKAKPRGARRIAFAEFLVALALLAQERSMPEDAILAQVASCSGPRRNSTTPEWCRLHDDKTTYTGVYSKGGPKTLDGTVPDLAKILSREPARYTAA